MIALSRHRKRGQGLVEFVASIPLLLLFIGLIMDGGQSIEVHKIAYDAALLGAKAMVAGQNGSYIAVENARGWGIYAANPIDDGGDSMTVNAYAHWLIPLPLLGSTFFVQEGIGT